MIRAFIALPLPDAAISSLLQAGRAFRLDADRVKWARPAQMHLTVKFLGDLAPETVETCGRVLEKEVDFEGAVTLRLGAFGVFGDPRRATLLWADVEGELDRLGRLARRVDEALLPLGVPVERRPFRPHITVARTRKGARVDLHRTVGARPAPVTWTADRLVLYESKLQPGGALHQARAVVQLT